MTAIPAEVAAELTRLRAEMPGCCGCSSSFRSRWPRPGLRRRGISRHRRGPVHDGSPPDAKVAFFGALFAARTDVYAVPDPGTAGHAATVGQSWPAPGCHRPAQMVEWAWGAVPGLLLARIPQAAFRTQCACEPGAPTRSYAELRLSSRPRARYQSRPGVPLSVARHFAATSPIASTITPARVRLSTAARATATSMTSVIRCCRRLASRASCRVPDMGAGSADPMLIVISSRSPRNHLRGAPRNSGARRTPAIQVVCACESRGRFLAASRDGTGRVRGFSQWPQGRTCRERLDSRSLSLPKAL